MKKETNISHGLQWGLIIGLVYCILLFLRYNQGNNNPLMLGVWALIGYIVVLVLLLICGFQRRKQLGGFIELKDAFQTMFVAVLIFELFYLVFNYIYFNYVEPNFFANMKDSMEAYMEKNNVSQEKIDEAMANFDKQSAKSMNLGNAFLSYAIWVCVSGVIALIFSLIVKRKDPFAGNRDISFDNNKQPA